MKTLAQQRRLAVLHDLPLLIVVATMAGCSQPKCDVEIPAHWSSDETLFLQASVNCGSAVVFLGLAIFAALAIAAIAGNVAEVVDELMERKRREDALRRELEQVMRPAKLAAATLLTDIAVVEAAELVHDAAAAMQLAQQTTRNRIIAELMEIYRKRATELEKSADTLPEGAMQTERERLERELRSVVRDFLTSNGE
jgi:hypothetical protein